MIPDCEDNAFTVRLRACDGVRGAGYGALTSGPSVVIERPETKKAAAGRGFHLPENGTKRDQIAWAGCA
jgi:hypothetical protein